MSEQVQLPPSAQEFAIPQSEKHTGRFAVYGISSERGRPHIFIELLGRDQSWKVFHVMADSGNDLNLFNIDEATRLGIDPKKEGTPFKVAGISGPPEDFYMVDVVMKIKETAPFRAKAGFGNLRENLLGRQYVFPRFDVVFSPGHVVFWERRHAEKMYSYAGRYSYR